MMTSDLERLFAYDLWANTRWLESLAQGGWPDVETNIFRHILSVQQIWLERVEGRSPRAIPSPGLDLEAMVDLNTRWIAIITTRDMGTTLQYRRLNGEAIQSSLGDIAQHVIYHGTYHRGELRGLCRSKSVEEFPETDFLGYCLTKDR